MSIFDKWNKAVDGEALKEDVKKASENSREFEEVPYGDYEIKVEKMELVECKSEKHKGEPMFSAWFTILNGKHKNSKIFMNQLIVEGFQIHIVNEFLKSLDTGVKVEFTGDYEEYNDMILDVLEGTQKLEYVLEYTANKKGYNQYKISEVFEV